MLFIGTAGYSYDDWIGPVYQGKAVKNARQMRELIGK